MTDTAQTGLVASIWDSFLTLPTWVKVWVMVILAPVNMASLFFMGEPLGILIAILSISAMMISMIFLVRDRGFSNLVSAGHVVPWTILVLLLIFARPEGSAAYGTFLTVLLVVNVISLVFDYNDAIRWIKGDRGTPD